MPVARKYEDELSPYQRGFCELVADRSPFALVSLRLNPGKTAWFATKEAAWNNAWPMVGKLFLRLDHGFHKTRFVVRNVPTERRFDGICVLEKHRTQSGHLHIAVFCQKRLSDEERATYLAFLLTRANTEPADVLEPTDLRLLRDRKLTVRSPADTITKQLLPSMTCHVRGIHTPYALGTYLAKEVWEEHASSCSDFRMLSEFYSEKARVA